MIGISILQAEGGNGLPYVPNDSTGPNDHTVVDSVSKLEWQDNEIGTPKTWPEAINHCESLSLGGYSDWRLPNINELRSISDMSKGYPAIVTGFTNVGSTYYWSSSTLADHSVDAWFVDFRDGQQNISYKGYSSYVRCVRAGQ